MSELSLRLILKKSFTVQVVLYMARRLSGRSQFFVINITFLRRWFHASD